MPGGPLSASQGFGQSRFRVIPPCVLTLPNPFQYTVLVTSFLVPSGNEIKPLSIKLRTFQVKLKVFKVRSNLAFGRRSNGGRIKGAQDFQISWVKALMEPFQRHFQSLEQYSEALDLSFERLNMNNENDEGFIDIHSDSRLLILILHPLLLIRLPP
ncbi:hypothetical protein L484_019919 [Morus notabilis]|uniref:Uncharacterized protein n=1 Tax=Morus notabilis TaxID=981085 RepID=W9RH52_9ROSA|nr:hypothetical protein L484_019919 [Morus notabilis]